MQEEHDGPEGKKSAGSDGAGGSASAGRVGMRSKSSRDVTVSCIACDVAT